MFNFFKNKQSRGYLLSKELQLIVCNRVVEVLMQEYDFESEFIPLSEYTKNIIDMNASLYDVLKFADEYGCTVDYLLGRTDTPYYTL